MLYCGEVEVCIMNASLNKAGLTGTLPERIWIIEAWDSAANSLWVEWVTVTWPDGAALTLRDPDADCTYEVPYPTG